MNRRRKLTATDTMPAMQLAHNVPSAPTCTSHADWQQECLTEARGILADIAHHPDTLVVLACRVVCRCSVGATEQADALGLMHLLGVGHHSKHQTQQWRATL